MIAPHDRSVLALLTGLARCYPRHRALQLPILPRGRVRCNLHRDRIADEIEAVISRPGLGMLLANPRGLAK
jgi:hypothetical protein